MHANTWSNTSWGNVCRICTSPAEYEVFARIPAYLHATTNEFLSWQKPINVLLEETTGLKVTPEDGLPRNICALCISYLKHAASFREQCISNALGLHAVSLLHAQRRRGATAADKDSALITAQELSFAEERQNGTNLLLNNSCQQLQDQDKVCKQLLNNSFQSSVAVPTPQHVEQQLRYLNLLFNKDTNAGLRPKQSNTLSGAGGSNEIPAAAVVEEDFQTATSSEDNEDAGVVGKHNIFSYKEKNFEEDDIMDNDELRDAVTINIPESCKERKCRACSRRFMFEESYNEHMETCIEYKFLTYIEEINRLLDIRRNKAISPHEFIRRMIFCLRKTCEWLQKANCADMLLPDLLKNGSNHNGGGAPPTHGKKRLESEGKSSGGTSDATQEQPRRRGQAEKLRYKIPTDFESKAKGSGNILLANAGEEDDLTTSFLNLRSGNSTPISYNNNILYEIERSQSRNSNKSQQKPQNNFNLKKPIALLATSTTTTTTTSATIKCDGGGDATDNNARIAFLQKLQQAACPATPTSQQGPLTPVTPSISVRKDLLPEGLAPLPDNSIDSMPTPKSKVSLIFSARCNPCDIVFETLAALEVHNALHHNTMQQASGGAGAVTGTPKAHDLERKRIIALFEDEDDNAV